MNLNEYCGFDALGLAKLVDDGEVTPKELAKLALKGVEALNPTLNAVIEVFHDRIEGLDDKTLGDGPFKGVPFFLKDLGPMEEGRLCEMGSRLTKGFVAPYSSELAKKFKAAGLNTIGRTTTPEFGFTLTAESIATGQTRNPWNIERIAGGSSGGSGAMVAAGVVPVAHGNDGGGSTRIPASVNGLVGLKCSRARVSNAPDGDDISFPLYSDLVVTRTVRDTAAILDAVEGPAPGEAVPFGSPPQPYLSEVNTPPKHLKIALSLDAWGPYSSEPEVKSEITKIANHLEDLGHIIEIAKPEIDFDGFFPEFSNSFFMTAPMHLEEFAEIMGRPIDDTTVEPILLKAYEKGKSFSLNDFYKNRHFMHTISRQLGSFYEGFDLLLTPVLAKPVPKLGIHDLDHPELSLDDYFDRCWGTIPFTPLANATGTPAISLPLCMLDGMPLGAQFMASMGREDRLIQIAGQLEKSIPWASRKPNIHVSNLD